MATPFGLPGLSFFGLALQADTPPITLFWGILLWQRAAPSRGLHLYPAKFPHPSIWHLPKAGFHDASLGPCRLLPHFPGFLTLYVILSIRTLVFSFSLKIVLQFSGSGMGIVFLRPLTLVMAILVRIRSGSSREIFLPLCFWWARFKTT